MKKCPNPSYNGIKCPYALSKISPLPCYGSRKQCDEWREKIEETRKNK